MPDGCECQWIFYKNFIFSKIAKFHIPFLVNKHKKRVSENGWWLVFRHPFSRHPKYVGIFSYLFYK